MADRVRRNDDYTTDLPARAWEVAGRYGTWYVDEYHPRETGRGVYDSLNVPTRKLAEKVASLLNNVYADGRVTGWADHEDHLTQQARDAARKLARQQAVPSTADDWTE